MNTEGSSGVLSLFRLCPCREMGPLIGRPLGPKRFVLRGGLFDNERKVVCLLDVYPGQPQGET